MYVVFVSNPIDRGPWTPGLDNCRLGDNGPVSQPSLDKLARSRLTRDASGLNLASLAGLHPESFLLILRLCFAKPSHLFGLETFDSIYRTYLLIKVIYCAHPPSSKGANIAFFIATLSRFHTHCVGFNIARVCASRFVQCRTKKATTYACVLRTNTRSLLRPCASCSPLQPHGSKLESFVTDAAFLCVCVFRSHGSH